MTDDVVPSSGAESPAAGTAPQYRAVSAEIHDVDDGLAIVTSELLPAALTIRAASAVVLRHCLAERSLPEHADHAARELGLASGRDLDPVVEALARQGLLRRLDRPSVAGIPAAAGAEIRTLAILTADRPDYLRRCLRSCLERLEAHGRDLRVLVVDASRDPEQRQRTEREVRAANAAADRDVEYAGESSRKALAVFAASRGVNERALEWLLPETPAQRSAGGGRNHLLLLTAGTPVLMVDDDTVCATWRHEDAGDGVAFVGHVDPNDTRVFAVRRDAIAAVQTTADDLLAAHESLLGHRLADLFDRGGSGRDLTGVCHHLLPAFDGLRPTWTVRATWAGLAGDAGTNGPLALLFSAGATRARLAAGDGLAAALASREVVRSVKRPTVTDEPWFMAYCAAVDASVLLPPFSPVGTNEDGLFGAMLRMCDPTAFIAQIPYGIVHDSSRPSAYDPDALAAASGLRLADLVSWLSSPAAAASTETVPAERMRGLGRHLSACGRLGSRAWRAYLTRSVADARRRLLVATESVLDSGFDYPAAWRQAIRRYQQAILDRVTAADMCVPAEYRSAASIDEAIDAVRRDVGMFGEALIAWPDLWAMCGEPGRRE
jgi:hypothetical protein